MKNPIKKFLGACILLALPIAGCKDYVQNIDPPIDLIKDEFLNDEKQVDFLITGLSNRFANVYSNVTLQAGGLSDEMIFDNRVPNATFPTFLQIDEGDPLLDNNSVSNLLTAMGSYRFHADNLVERVGKITFTDEELKTRALYFGNLHGGIARHLYAAYIGLNAREGGSPIDGGPFIPSTALHDSALAKLNAALTHAADDYDRKVVQSVIAKIHLIEGRYAQARTAAEAGLASGDEDFVAQYSAQTIANEWWTNGGVGRSQFVADPRFGAYLEAEPEESARIPMTKLTGAQDFVYWRQAKYAVQEAPHVLVNWQEMQLILAETALRISSDATEALTRINSVRESHGLAARTATALDSVYIERDKELFGTGARLTDQRRFNRWHLEDGSWWYLPITLPERNTNPNLRPE
jgi:tetratricopeptide (TPR) repeat protein